MSDRGLFNDDAVFKQSRLDERAGSFIAWDSPLGCSGRVVREDVTPSETPAIDLEAMRAAAFDAGFEEGRRVGQAEIEPEREALAAVISSLGVLEREPTDALAALLATTVERLVHQIIGEVPINPIVLVRRAESAAALIGEEVSASRLLVNPEDLPLFARSRVPVEIVGDPMVERGAVRLEWARGWIEDGPAIRLERLRAALDRLALPQ